MALVLPGCSDKYPMPKEGSELYKWFLKGFHDICALLNEDSDPISPRNLLFILAFVKVAVYPAAKLSKQRKIQRIQQFEATFRDDPSAWFDPLI